MGITDPQYPVALVIGVTSFESMTREDAQGYADALGDSLKKLRHDNIPVIWGNIGHGGNKIIIPSDSNDKRPQDFSLLLDMSFVEAEGERGANTDIHFKFLCDYGPRRNEVIYRKPTKDTLLHPGDAAFGPAYKRELLLQAGVKFESQRTPFDPPGLRYIQHDQVDSAFMKLFNDPTLADFLNTRNADSILIMGAIANICVTETAVSAALKGYDTRIAVDRVLGWNRPLTTFAERQKASMVWQNPGVSVDHAAAIHDQIRHLMADPIRSFTRDDRRKIKNIRLQTVDNFINRFSVRPPEQQQQGVSPSRPQHDVSIGYQHRLVN